MVTYRGPNLTRLSAQFGVIQSYAGESCIWRHYVSAGGTTSSAWLAGGGVTRYYTETRITGLFAAPQMGESRFRESQTPAGQLMAGDMMVSTFAPLSSQDELVWRGVTYRIEGDAVPEHLGGRLVYRTLLRRGDATG